MAGEYSEWCRTWGLEEEARGKLRVGVVVKDLHGGISV